MTASVVLTTHNRPDLLVRAASSVLAQTARDFELIIVDDGSTPPARVDSSISDPRVRLVRREIASGPSAARNEGLEHARGRWVTFLDDDDWLLPDMLERSIESAGRSTLPPPVAVWSDVRIESPTGEVSTRGRAIDLVRDEKQFSRGAPTGYSFHCVNSLVVETELLRDIGGWDESLLTWEQADLFLRLEPVCSIQALPHVTYVVVDHEGTRQHRNALARGAAITAVVDKHHDVWRGNRRRQALLLASAAASYRQGGDRRAALGTSLRAIRTAPFSPSGYRQLLGCVLKPVVGPPPAEDAAEEEADVHAPIT